MGPVGKGIIANEAAAHKKIGNMLKYLAPEYYTEKQMMSYVGEDGSTIETFTFDPAQLDPMSAETPFETKGMTRRERCMWLAEQIETTASPMELLTSTHQQEQMRYMFFLQHNMPISKSTCMEKLDVPNYGTTPGNTEREKYEYEQEQDILRAIRLKKMAIEETGEPPEQPNQQGQGGGPKPKNATGPKLEQKGAHGGAPRAVLSTSK
jgi:hypothetical protein